MSWLMIHSFHVHRVRNNDTMAEERRCYTLSFKKKVLDKLEENGNNIAQTARDFNIHRKNVQRWIVQKDLIIKACEQNGNCFVYTFID